MIATYDIKTEGKTNNIRIAPLSNRFAQIPNWVIEKVVFGFGEASAAAMSTYALFWSLHPDLVITPRYLAELSKKDGSNIKEATFRSHFRQLEKMKLLYIRDNGPFVDRSYFIIFANEKSMVDAAIEQDVKPPDLADFYLSSRVKNITRGENGQNHDNQGLTEKVTKSPCNKNNTASIYKVRVHKNNTVNNSSSDPRQGELSEGAEIDTTAPLIAIENELKGVASIGRDLVDRCLANYGPQYTLEAIIVSKEKAPDNPGAFFNGASRSRYQSIDDRIKSKIELTKPKKTMSEDNVQGYRNRFLTDMMTTGDFDRLLNLENCELLIEPDFITWCQRKGYEL